MVLVALSDMKEVAAWIPSKSTVGKFWLERLSPQSRFLSINAPPKSGWQAFRSDNASLSGKLDVTFNMVHKT